MTHHIRHFSLQARGFRFDAIAAGPHDGEVVLLLHGFPQFADAWISIMSELAAAQFHCIAVNQRGYSEEAQPTTIEAYNLEELMGDVLSFADVLNVDRFHLIGHDWGGIVAWNFAAQFPRRLHTLTVLSTPHPDILFDAIANDPDQKMRSEYVTFFRLPNHAAENSMLADNAAKLKSAYRDSLSPDAIERNVARLSQGNTLTNALNWYRALDFNRRIGRISVPTLFVWGTSDHALGALAAHATGSLIDSDYAFLPLDDCSHWLLEEAPEVISDAFLRRDYQPR
jgi:pimeloyl-ACP methyl ester carboxylesterase